ARPAPTPGRPDRRAVTVVGPADADSYGVHASSFGPAGGAVSLNGAVIRGFGHALVAQAGSYYCGEDINMLPMYCPSPTTINVSYSDFDPGHDIADGTYGRINSGAGNLNVDPAFRNAGAGDYSLRRISPVIDRGDPHAPFAGDSTTDLAGGPRKA